MLACCRCSFAFAVLVVGMVKDVMTDLGRRRRDRLLNQRICCIVDGHTPQLRLLKWQSVHVGNILRLTDGEEVPADIVVLATSNADGVAYVETSKLDGETNLKFKQGVKETRGESSPLSIAGIRGRVVCEKPSAVMDAFTGSLKLDAHPRATPLDIVNFIQRGPPLHLVKTSAIARSQYAPCLRACRLCCVSLCFTSGRVLLLLLCILQMIPQSPGAWLSISVVVCKCEIHDAVHSRPLSVLVRRGALAFVGCLMCLEDAANAGRGRHVT